MTCRGAALTRPGRWGATTRGERRGRLTCATPKSGGPTGPRGGGRWTTGGTISCAPRSSGPTRGGARGGPRARGAAGAPARRARGGAVSGAHVARAPAASRAVARARTGRKAHTVRTASKRVIGCPASPHGFFPKISESTDFDNNAIAAVQSGRTPHFKALNGQYWPGYHLPLWTVDTYYKSRAPSAHYLTGCGAENGRI